MRVKILIIMSEISDCFPDLFNSDLQHLDAYRIDKNRIDVGVRMQYPFFPFRCFSIRDANITCFYWLLFIEKEKTQDSRNSRDSKDISACWCDIVSRMIWNK